MPNKTLIIGANSQLIDINITGSLYADGSNLTNLNATNLSSGTVNWNRLPTSRIYDANTSRTANAVLAAPNGSAGAATFRALVAADIPALAASKITSGTFDAARIPALNYISKITSTDNAVVRFNGTGGTVQNSNVTIDDTGNINAPYDNNFLSHGNEFNFIPTITANTEVHINHRQRSSNGAGRITKYHFKDGAGGTLATISSGQFSGNAATASKATAANITTTANAIAIYSNTTGTFSTKATANGAAYATAANGALTFGTLPIAQGGTGKTTAADAWTALGGGAAGKLGVKNSQSNSTATVPTSALVYSMNTRLTNIENNGAWSNLTTNIKIYQTNFAVSVSTNESKINANSGLVKIKITLVLPGAKTISNVGSLLIGFPTPKDPTATRATSGTCNGVAMSPSHTIFTNWLISSSGGLDANGTLNTSTQDTYVLEFIYQKA